VTIDVVPGQTDGYSPGSAAASFSLTLPNPPTEGLHLVAAVGIENAQVITPPAGWTEAETTSFAPETGIWVRQVEAGDTMGPYTWTWPVAVRCGGAFAEFSGLEDAVDPTDVTATAEESFTAAANAVGPTGTPGQTESLAFAMWKAAGGVGFGTIVGVSDGYTILASEGLGDKDDFIVAWRALSTATAQNPTATWTNSVAGGSVIAVFAGAGGAPSPGTIPVIRNYLEQGMSQ
jgi:hypothetical protein